MPSLLKYSPQSRQSLAAPVASAPQVQTPRADTGGAEVFQHIDNFMKQAGPALASEYRRQETARVDDVLLNASGKFAVWQAEYEQNNRGSLGLNAMADYTAAWHEIASEAEKEFDGAGHEIFGDLLRQRLKEKGEAIGARGLRFAGQQRKEWENSQWQSQQDEFYRAVAANPDDAATILRERESLKGSWAAKNPGQDHRAVFNKIDEQTVISAAEAMLAREDTAGARAVLGGALNWQGGGLRLGDAIASEESGSEGVHKVNYLPTDGTAYGKWQLSSKQGSYQEWLAFLESDAAREKYGEGVCREITTALKGAGPANTGSSSGRHVHVYKTLAARYPQVFEESQREFLKRSHYDGAMAKLPAGLRRMVDGDAALEEMVFSTAVQMGAAGCARILGAVYHEGMGREELVRAAYASRGRLENFRSSSPQVRRSVAERCAREAETILAMSPGRPSLGAGHMQALLKRADALDAARARTMQAEMKNGLAQFQAASEDGHILDMPYSENQVYAAFGPEEGAAVWCDLQDSRALAMDMAAMKTMGPAELASFLEARQPDPASQSYRDDMRRYGKVVSLAGSLQERMRRDAAAHVLDTYPPAAKAREAFLARLGNLDPGTANAYAAAMEGGLAQRGLADGKIFSQADARGIGAAIMTAADPVAAAQNFIHSFGVRGARALREIAGSLSPTMSLIASGMNPEAARLLLKAERQENFDKASMERLRITGTDKTDFEERVWSVCEDLNRTFLSGGDQQMPGAITSAVGKLALTYMQRLNLKRDEAIARAHEDVVGERYEIVKRGGFFARAAPPCRIPKTLPTGDIKRGMEAVLAAAPMERIAVALPPGVNGELASESLREAIARNGHWITDEEEGGAVLFLDTAPVWTADGQPLRMSWEELARIGRERQEMPEEYETF